MLSIFRPVVRVTVFLASLETVLGTQLLRPGPRVVATLPRSGAGGRLGSASGSRAFAPVPSGSFGGTVVDKVRFRLHFTCCASLLSSSSVDTKNWFWDLLHPCRTQDRRSENSFRRWILEICAFLVFVLLLFICLNYVLYYLSYFFCFALFCVAAYVLAAYLT